MAKWTPVCNTVRFGLGTFGDERGSAVAGEREGTGSGVWRMRHGARLGGAHRRVIRSVDCMH